MAKTKLKFSDWRIFEFLKEDNGRFSSARLFAFFIIFNAILEWQNAIWKSIAWTPSWEEISLIAGVLGFKIVQKSFEEKKSNNNIPTKEDKEEAEEVKI